MGARLMSRLTLADIRAVRATPGRSVLLFLTDRCPVGCDHCSVGALMTEPGIADWDRFEAVLDVIADRPGVDTVAISGGEPFVERRALPHATRRLSQAGKSLVVYTAGHWGEPAPWIREVLGQVGTIVLSSDSYHARQVPPAVFAAAAGAVVAEGCRLIVQTLEPDLPMAEAALEAALGSSWRQVAEVSTVPTLPYGRAAGRRLPATRHTQGGCPLVGTPLLRTDGMVAACCNEQVIKGMGPARLRRSGADRDEIAHALDDLAADPVLWSMRAIGPDVLAAHADVGGPADTPCGTCWRVLDRLPPAFSATLGLLRTG
jgi:hypothetical protein